MKLIKPSFKIENISCYPAIDNKVVLRFLERIGRVCYKSEDKITNDSAEKFIKGILKSGHESIIEHANVSVRFIVDRGVTHELVRHRLCAFSQESTRYVSSIDKSQFIIHNDNDVINAYNRGISMKKIASMSNRKYNEWDIYKILNSHDIPRRNLGNNGLLYHDYFDNIDTAEKSYLLGLILADGSLRKNNSKQITITQHSDVIWYIHRMIKNFIKPICNLGYDRNCNNISWVSNHMWQSLIDKGIIPNKTYDMTLNHVDLLLNSIWNFRYDFLRGFLDGDGNIRFFQQNNVGQTESCDLGWCGNQYIINAIQNIINTEFNYSKKIRKQGNIYRYSITQPYIAKAVIHKMYNNFLFPYGNPFKASRCIQQLEKKPNKIASWGDKNFQIILPLWIDFTDASHWKWIESMDHCEETYSRLIEYGQSPQQARSVLPNCLKTEIVCTTNIREWRHILKLRTSPAAHPQMREIMIPLLGEFKKRIPILFDDIDVKEQNV